MNIKRLFTYVLILSIALFLSSCSGSREGEPSASAGTSQINLFVESAGAETFTTDEGYEVTLDEAKIHLVEIEIAGEGGGGHTHEHAISRHDDDGDSAACHFEGPYEIDLTKSETDLGIQNTDPGTYSAMTFLMAEEHDHDHTVLKEEHEHEGTLVLEGKAVKDGVTYQFHAVLEMEESLEREIPETTLIRGAQTRLKLFLGVHHWLNGVDFSTAPLEDGVYHINNDEAPELAAVIIENATTHVVVQNYD